MIVMVFVIGLAIGLGLAFMARPTADSKPDGFEFEEPKRRTKFKPKK